MRNSIINLFYHIFSTTSSTQWLYFYSCFLYFQSRSSSIPQLNNDEGSPWAPNTPTHNGASKENDLNHVNSLPETLRSDDLRSVLSPQKPVNLLPQVPINSNAYRKLSENEEHDCEIIGMWKLL